MTTKDEALKMAIEAMGNYQNGWIPDEMVSALLACKEALEQPAQKVNRKNKMNLIELAKECGATLNVMPDETGFYTKDAWNTQVVFSNTTDENDKPCIKALESFAQAVIENYIGVSKEALEQPAQDDEKIYKLTNGTEVELTYTEELAYQAGFEAGRSFERGCDD